MTRRLLVVLAAAAGLLSACAKEPQAPADVGVCWHMVKLKDGKLSYNQVAKGLPNLESCGVQLETMRVRFIQMGGDRTTIAGAFQGRFLFVEREGVFSSSKLEGGAYLALPRGRDGQLIIPGAPPRAANSAPVG